MPRTSEQKNVLISGVTSSIGRNLALLLYKDKRVGKILGVAKGEKPYYFNDLDPKKFIYRNCNILKYRELKDLFLSKTFKKADINAVVHLAFVNRVSSSMEVHDLNVKGTKELLEMCEATGQIKKFIFKSSDVVYKIRPHNPIYLDENAELNFDPHVDPWIKDRVDADMICRSFMDSKTMNIIILRMSNIIGRNVVGQLNSYYDSKPVIKTLGFNPMINLLHMRDVIQAIMLAFFRNVKGIYNIAGADTAPLSVFAELSGRTIVSVPEPLMGPVNWLQRKLGLTTYYYSVDKDRQKYSALLDFSKAEKDLGFKPEGRIEF